MAAGALLLRAWNPVTKLPLLESSRSLTPFPRVTLVRQVVGPILCRALPAATRPILRRRRLLAACALASFDMLSRRLVPIALFAPMFIVLRRRQSIRIPSPLVCLHLIAMDWLFGALVPRPIVIIPFPLLAVSIVL